MLEMRQDWEGLVSGMQREMEKLVSDFSSRKPPSARFSPGTWEPAVDVFETETEVIVLAELPSVDENEVEITVHERVLLIRGERRDVKQGIRRRYYQMEIAWGLFERAVYLPASVEGEACSAHYEKGLLEIVLPKANNASPQRINVKEIKSREQER